ncbi:hypothetical protein A9Q84_19375 [Halobacteriovorax marinus]|uniref:Phytanoyl-CoA dioxygenase n=1 Tax=Halobacteriovorax marinus TaxID=97084 RepID=A0A1Y5F2H8_9BACT|nr:hypothetical protein A9Q84_19375 [Halobacteriovorax marinus]
MDNFIDHYTRNGFAKVSFKEIDSLKLKMSKILGFSDFDNIHELVTPSEINDLRLKIISGLSNKEVKDHIYSSLDDELNALIGSEIAIQKNINVNIQIPGCDQSLIPFHSDVLCGNSPYEVVVWIPFVNVYDTKSFFVYDLETSALIKEDIRANVSRSELEKKYLKKKKFIELKVGEALVFSPFLMHGNQVNEHSETRLSLNIRFKNYFSPYHDKKLLSYFEAYKLGTQTRLALNYEASYEL